MSQSYRSWPRWVGHGALFLLAITIAYSITITFGSVARAQESGPRVGKVSSEIRDTAGLFAADAIATATRELDRIERASGAAIIIETLDTLKGDPADKAAIRLAERSGIDGVFVLIARKERKLEILASRHYREAITDARRNEIRDAFYEGFHRGDFNGGSSSAWPRSVRPWRRCDASNLLLPRRRSRRRSTWSSAAGSHSNSEGTKAESPLVARNQVRLTLAGARAILAGAEAKAQAMGLNRISPSLTKGATCSPSAEWTVRGRPASTRRSPRRPPPRPSDSPAVRSRPALSRRTLS